MASIIKTSTGRWRAQVYVGGKRPAKTFDTKAEARDWASRVSVEIKDKIENPHGNKLFADVLARYARDISPRKKGARWEIIRLELIKRDPIARVKLDDLETTDIAEWRDRRLLQVSGSSVSREMQLLSHACKIAKREWKWLEFDPTAEVSRPRKNPARDRLISAGEIERLLFVAAYDRDRPPANIQQRAMHAFLFAIETAMRAGEIVNLGWDQVFLDSRVATLRQETTKNNLGRDVPLSSEAVRLLEKLPRGEGPCFGLRSAQLDAAFRKVRDIALIDDLHFHDTRHEAITRLAKKLDVLELARAVGHRNLSMLQIYYNESAADLAKRLD